MEPTTQGNVIQIKRGPGTPPVGTLAPYELGFDTSGNQLYIGGDGDNAPAIQISGAGGGGGASTTYIKSTIADYPKLSGEVDDTKRFQRALAANRVLYVPGGEYKLSDTLTIRQNCELELAQDTVLKFQQLDGNCIELRSSSTLRGNHSILSVPFKFTGNVISSATTEDTSSDTPPYRHWSPQWKRGRYIYDINIIKPDGYGLFNLPNLSDGCSGNGIYLHCDGTSEVRFMWGVIMSGVRIAGAFTNGIQVFNQDPPTGPEDNAWNHDMRIEAVIEGCETGVSLTNCNGPHLAVTVQPQKTHLDKVPYAKWGVYLNDCKFVDMSSSVVWDWNETNTLLGTNEQYASVAMYGECSGLILYDYAYYRTSADIRERVYSDRATNLERMVVMQEPITRWFKPKAVDNKLVPHFDDGYSEQPLMLQSELKKYFNTQTVNDFDDVLSVATDENGLIFGDKGYIPGRFKSLGDGVTIVTGGDASTYYRVTGFIKCKSGDAFNTRHLSFERQDGHAGAVFYDQNYQKLTSITSGLIVNHGWTGAISDYTQTDYGCSFVIGNGIAPKYVRFVFHTLDVGDFPAIAINQDLGDKEYGFLADSIKVDDDNIESTKLNTLQTRVNNAEQNIASSIAEIEAVVEELETEVDEKISNISITTEQVNFILPADGQNVQIPLFTDRLSTAMNAQKNGIYNDIGYKTNTRIVMTTGVDETVSGYIATGFIECTPGSTINIENATFNTATDGGNTGLVVYDAQYNKLTDNGNITGPTIGVGNQYFAHYKETANGCQIIFQNKAGWATVKYVRFSFRMADFKQGEVKIAVDEDLTYRTEWQGEPLRFDDTLYAQNVVLTSPNGNLFKLIVSDDGVLTSAPYPGENS